MTTSLSKNPSTPLSPAVKPTMAPQDQTERAPRDRVRQREGAAAAGGVDHATTTLAAYLDDQLDLRHARLGMLRGGGARQCRPRPVLGGEPGQDQAQHGRVA